MTQETSMNTETLSVLNGLIETTKDGEKGFTEAAKRAHAPHLRSLFTEFATECARGATELQGCVNLLGGSAETSGTLTAALHRGWMTLKTSLTADDDLALLEECERGEDHAKASYSKALKAELTPQIRTLLQRQYEGTVRHHDRIRDLRNRAKEAA